MYYHVLITKWEFSNDIPSIKKIEIHKLEPRYNLLTSKSNKPDYKILFNI